MKVLYLTYNGLTEPLGRRQVLPYVLGLSAKGWRYVVVSFEKPETESTDAVARVGSQLQAVGASWHALRYHRQPPIVSTCYDLAQGAVAGLRSGRRIRLIHARSAVSAALAVVLARVLRVPWVYDVRGLLAQEYADAGHWSRRGLPFRVTEASERRLLRSADGLVFLTDRIRRELEGSGRISTETPLAVVPCCVDTSIFAPDPEARHRLRRDLGYGANPVLVYAGSLGSWYCMDEMLDFFEEARRQLPALQFLVLTMNPEIAQAALAARASARDVRVFKALPDDVPQYLAAADAGICFLRDSVSKRASSPTKYGEYLSSGLPVITNRWTGDAAQLGGARAWLLIASFERKSYERAAHELREILSRPDDARVAARRLAEREYSLETAIERYHELYGRVLRRADDLAKEHAGQKGP